LLVGEEVGFLRMESCGSLSAERSDGR
jgi:hypothetical protein